METLPEVFEHRAWFAGTDRPTIQADDGDQLGGGAGQKHFIGDEEIMTGHGHFTGVVTGGFRQFENCVAGDSLEDAGVERRRQYLVFTHRKNVVARAFRDFPLVIEH